MTMKYFTPQRWIRFQDVSDERTFLANSAEWEEAVAAYRRMLAEIRPRLPISVRQFLASGSLHDAELTAVWRTRGRLTLLVRPEPPSDQYVLLSYTLVGELSVNHSALPAEWLTEQATWMYDEIAVETAFRLGPPVEDVFVHSILLSNGQEMTIRFSKLTVSRTEALFPVREERSGERPQASASQSA